MFAIGEMDEEFLQHTADFLSGSYKAECLKVAGARFERATSGL